MRKPAPEWINEAKGDDGETHFADAYRGTSCVKCSRGEEERVPWPCPAVIRECDQ